MAYVLRHNPHRYNLSLDEEGWIGIDNLLDSMGKYGSTIEIKKENLYELIANQQKNRFEIKDDRIRALYGHSITIKKRECINTSRCPLPWNFPKKSAINNEAGIKKHGPSICTSFNRH